MIAVEYCVVRGGTSIQDRRPPMSGDMDEADLVAGATVIGSPSKKKKVLLTKVVLARIRLFMKVKLKKSTLVFRSPTIKVPTCCF